MSAYLVIFFSLFFAHPWQMFQKDALHTGRATVNGPGEASLLWQSNLGATTSSSPVVADDGTIYIGTSGGYLVALDAGGDELWRFNASTPINATPVILNSGYVCVGTSAGDIIAVNSSGTEQWRFEASGQIAASSSPIVEGNYIYVASDSNLYSINVTNGKQQWAFTASGSIDVSPAKSSDYIYIQTWWPGPHYLYRVSSTGSGSWDYETGGGSSSPTVSGEVVYLGCNDSYLYAVRSNGTTAFKKLLYGKITASPAVSPQNKILVGAWDSTFYCLNDAGDIEWNFKTSGVIKSSAAVDASGTAYFGSNDSTLYAVSADGQERWRFKAGHQITSSPAVGADGTIYFASYNGTLYAIGPGGGIHEDYDSSRGLQGFNISYRRGELEIAFAEPLDFAVSLRIVDVSGRLLYSNLLSQGTRELRWTPPASTRLVFVILEGQGGRETRKVVLL